MGNYIFLEGVENPRRGGQGRNLTTNVPKILDLKSSSERIFSKNCRWVPLVYEEMSFIYINTNEIPSELSRENLISSHVKITCYLCENITVGMAT